MNEDERFYTEQTEDGTFQVVDADTDRVAPMRYPDAATAQAAAGRLNTRSLTA